MGAIFSCGRNECAYLLKSRSRRREPVQNFWEVISCPDTHLWRLFTYWDARGIPKVRRPDPCFLSSPIVFLLSYGLHQRKARCSELVHFEESQHGPVSPHGHPFSPTSHLHPSVVIREDSRGFTSANKFHTAHKSVRLINRLEL
jgi:hypothetical protein